MMICMISNGVPFFCHSKNQILIIFQISTDNEESSGDLVLFECIENRRGVSIFITGIEGKVYDFFVRIFSVICVVNGKFVICSIGYGRFSFFLKTQSPVSFGRGGDSFGKI